MKAPTHAEWESVSQLSRIAQAAHVKAQLAALRLEEVLNDLRIRCRAPGNATLSMSADGRIKWVFGNTGQDVPDVDEHVVADPTPKKPINGRAEKRKSA